MQIKNELSQFLNLFSLNEIYVKLYIFLCCIYFDFQIYILNHFFIMVPHFLIKPNFTMRKTLEFLDLDKNWRVRGLSRTYGLSTFKKFSDSSIFVEVFPSKRTKMFFEKISTYTCIQALKWRMQALFLMQIQNLKSDFQDFDFLLFLSIKSESNQCRNDPSK